MNGSTNVGEILASHLLARVEKPSRYLGTELNAVLPEQKRGARVRLALAFPDLYDLGLGNLGLHILYATLNKLPEVYAERVYAPAPDMERAMREVGVRLFGLESKDTVDCFDGIGFTLQSELTYTNILNLIDLAGLPLRTADRREGDPLTFAGGPAVFNPEPLAPFMDFFVIGDGEDVVLEIARLLDRVHGREARLDALAKVPGIYVPARFEMETLPDGRILPPVDCTPIAKRTVRDLDGATFPVDYIVPFTKQVHDRISMEVLRGCTQGCRFCQAGMTTRPVRERTIDKIDELLDRTLAATGYEEVSLVSLSTCDYSRVRQMVDMAVRKAAPARVGVSLPSLRLDSFSVELADMVAGIRRTGLTFAPEAASPRLRSVINKWIPDEELLGMATQAYGLGWDHVKLYFMIGLPTERDDDIEAIADLTLRTVRLGRELNKKAAVHTGVSTFVPKPFTPFQWAAQIDIEETERRQGILDDRFRRERSVKFGRHHAEETFLEGLVTRADRRAGDLIEAAWRQGARFDAWSEHRDLDAWWRAIEEIGFDWRFELRERALDERLPWDHIDVHIPKSWFQEDWKRAMELKHAEDCRHSKCHRCGVIDVERALCAHMLRDNIEARKSEKAFVRAPPPPELGESPLVPGQAPIRPPEPPVVQRMLFRIGLMGEARFLGHLECANAWNRALRRARAPLCYSEGFHPHPKLTFSTARPVGEATLGDFMDVLLSERVEPALMMERLRAVLPSGFRVLSAEEIPIRGPSLMGAVTGNTTVLLTEGDAAEIALGVAGLLEAEEIAVSRKVKQKKTKGRRPPRRMREVDLRPFIEELRVLAEGETMAGLPLAPGQVGILLRARVVEGRTFKPGELVDLLELNPPDVRIVRLETRFAPELRKGPSIQSASPPGLQA